MQRVAAQSTTSDVPSTAPEKGMPATDSLLAHLQDQLAPLGAVMRRMFGSVGVFCEGLLIGLVHDDALHLRVDDGNRAMFGAVQQPFRYQRQGRPMELPYWRIQDRLLDDQEELLAWARAALAAARRVAAARGRKKPRRHARPA